jgi:hypothetical protein
MGRPRALVVCLPDPSRNPRPNRAIWLLHRRGYEVWVFSPTPRRPVAEISRVLSMRDQPRSPWLQAAYRLLMYGLGAVQALLFPVLLERLKWWLWGGSEALRFIRQGWFDVVLVEDLQLLAGVLDQRRLGTRVLYDAREYAPRELEASLLFRLCHQPLIRRQLHRCLSRVDGFFTVCQSLSDEYQREFGVRPAVVRSTPFYVDLQPKPCRSQGVRLVHHGNANRDRGLLSMIDVLKALDGRYTLDFYLVGNRSHLAELIAAAQGCPWIQFKQPIVFDDLVAALSIYDAGFYLLQPTGFNTYYALPNKFFEFIQARLAVLTGPSPEMARLIHRYGIGAVSDDFSPSSMVDVLNALTVDQITAMKARSGVAARQLCWEQESMALEKLLA